MNIIKAFELMKEGYEIRRKSWGNDEFVLYPRDNTIMCRDGNTDITEEFGSDVTDNFEIDDILADDWEIYEAK